MGPEIIGIGEIISTSSSSWKIKIDNYNYINGNIAAINSFIGSFDIIDKCERYIISNELGDGRLLSLPPELKKVNGEYIITCFIESSYIRTNAYELSLTIVTNENNDIFTENGNIAIVKGVDALPQKIREVLSLKKHETPYTSYGSRFYQFYEDYKDTKTLWLNRLLKLDVIRLASIPYLNKSSQYSISTPLMCVKRVNSIQLIESEKNENWIPVEFYLEIEGIGNWKKRIPILI